MNRRRFADMLVEVEQVVPEIVTRLGHGYLGQASTDRATTRKSKHRRDVAVAQDVEAERILRHRLRASLPDIGFVGEELTPSRDAETSLHWVIDALDGTLNYASGLPHFATSISLATRDETIFACVHDPNRSELFCATKGKGVTLNGRRLGILGPAKLETTIVGIGFGYDDEKAEVAMRVLSRLRTAARAIRMSGCASLDLAYVAAGRLSCFFHPYLKVWDRSAGELLVQEVRGSIVDVEALATQVTRARIAGNTDVVDFVRQAVFAELFGT
jgi:myo-inositol-1(or 4)-monophosphatase